MVSAGDPMDTMLGRRTARRYRERVAELRRWMRAAPVPGSVPDELPLLQAYHEERPGRFVDVDALFIQHHLGPLVPRLRAMIADGLARDRCWFVDIPYSTNPDVRSALGAMVQEEDRHPWPLDDPLEPYSRRQVERVESVVRRLLAASTGRHVLVVDDGAYFLRVLLRLRRTEPGALQGLVGRLRLVEQTTRGHRYLQEPAARQLLEELDAPAVTIARTVTKTAFEGPFIGESVARRLSRRMEADDDLALRSGARVAVVGFGTVGRATFRALTAGQGIEGVDVVEWDRARHEAIRRAGGRPLRRLRDDGAYDLIVGCTGKASFRLEDRVRLADGARLVSASSAAVEFNREGFVELADRLPDDEIEIVDREATRSRGIRADVAFRDGRREFTLVSAGFPVNFDGRIECIPLPLIQATHVLLYAAACQALAAKRPGVASLDPEVDRWIAVRALAFAEAATAATP